MTCSKTTRLLASAGALLLAAHVWHDVSGLPGRGVDSAFSTWFMPVAFLGSGLATLGRGVGAGPERRARLLLGSGLTLHALGSIYYSGGCATGSTPGFPSLADALWLSLYPLALTAVAMLTRSRFAGLSAAVWLDGAIAGSVVAALAAALVVQPVFDLTVS